LEHCYNNPNPGYNNVSDTNDLPINATTNHSRKRGLPQCQEQRRHTYQVALSPLVVRQIRWVVAEEIQFQYLHLPVPLSEWERQLPTPKGLTPKVTFSFVAPLFGFHPETAFSALAVSICGPDCDSAQRPRPSQ
jgi:hypothetical protein